MSNPFKKESKEQCCCTEKKGELLLGVRLAIGLSSFSGTMSHAQTYLHRILIKVMFNNCRSKYSITVEVKVVMLTLGSLAPGCYLGLGNPPFYETVSHITLLTIVRLLIGYLCFQIILTPKVRIFFSPFISASENVLNVLIKMLCEIKLVTVII